MNQITLQGIIKDIKFSHYVKDIEYYKANLLVKKDNDKEDIIPLKFKRFCCLYQDGDLINLTGNIRTFSTKDENKSHVDVYVFTYFDLPEEEKINVIQLDGNICKKGELRKTKNGLDVIDFIVANNLISNEQIFNTYIPIVAWGKQAKEINKMNVGDNINIEGHFSSRTYKKKINDTFEYRMAYEVNVDKINREEV